MPSYDILDRLPEIQCPVLVTVGRDDWIVPVSESEAIADRIPNSKLVVFEPLYDHDFDPARVEERVRNTTYHHATHNFAFRHNMPSYDILDRLPEIQCPVLV